MKIAFYAPLKPPDHPTPSGDRYMAALLMRALEYAGHSVVLASRFRSREGRGDAVAQVHLRRVGAAIAEVLTRRWETDTAVRPDLWFTYHVYHKAPDRLGPSVSRALGIPYVIAEGSHAAKQALGRWAEGYRAALAALQQADALISLNRNDQAGLKQVVSDAARLHYLAPFLDCRRIQNFDRRRLRQKLALSEGLPTDVPWLLVVAMMRPGDKTASYQILAKSLLRLPDVPWRLVVIGDGQARDTVLSALLGLGRDRARFLGRRDLNCIAEWLQAADLFVWPAVNEAYGMALLEAQAAGLPVVAGASGGVPDLVADGQTGLLTPVGDVDAFAEAVRAMLADPLMRRSMSARSAARVRNGHCLIHAAEGLQRILMPLLVARTP
jgi:glycosyltransferase involved in cell wall biosynthesis